EATWNRLIGGQRCIDATLDALRGDCCGRIDASPALAVDPHLGPRMRVRLADDQVAPHRVELPAVIARHDAGWNPRSARERCESGSKMLAEPATRVEQEIIDGVPFEARRLERVVELLLAKHREHRFDERFIARRRSA